MSQLGRLARRGLNKIGDAYCPGGDGVASFSELDCVRYATRMTDYIPTDDRSGLMLVLNVFGLLPRAWVRGIVGWLEAPKWLDWQQEFTGLDRHLAPLVRTLRLGFRGVAMGLYYSGKPAPQGCKTMHEQLEFDIRVQPLP